MADVESHGLAPAIDEEGMVLLRSDLPLLNEIRAAVLRRSRK